MTAFTQEQIDQLLKPIRPSRVLRDGNGCHLWLGSLNENGYGRIRVQNREWKAHRYAYAVHHGAEPVGLDVEHLCHTSDASCFDGPQCVHRRCVNPDHLEAVTRKVNLGRGHWPNAAKTQCPAGHPYDEVNTYVNARGGRECQTCRRDRSARRYLALKEAS